MRFSTFTAAIVTLILSGSINAATFNEDFSDAFPAWESNWFASNSNAQNFYGVGSSSGGGYLWLTDDDSDRGAGEAVDINFDSAFSLSLTFFSMDVNTFVDTVIEIYDGSGSMLVDFNFDTGAGYETVSISSSSGISGFSLFSRYQIEGNTAIDNIVAITAIPVPAAIWLFASGIVSLLGFARVKGQKN